MDSLKELDGLLTAARERERALTLELCAVQNERDRLGIALIAAGGTLPRASAGGQAEDEARVLFEYQLNNG